jgi:hypothetical protein
MPVDFKTALASSEQSFINALIAADLVLTELGARRGEIIGRDDVEELTGRDVEDDEVSTRGGIMPIRDLIADWRDATLEYSFPQFSASLQIILWQAGFLNAFLNVGLGQIKRMHRLDKLGQYNVTLARLGAALRAKGGLGDVELPIDPIRPESIPDIIFATSAPLGLVAMAETSREELDRKAADHGPYRIEPLLGFYLLINDSYAVLSG